MFDDPADSAAAQSSQPPWPGYLPDQPAFDLTKVTRARLEALEKQHCELTIRLDNLEGMLRNYPNNAHLTDSVLSNHAARILALELKASGAVRQAEGAPLKITVWPDGGWAVEEPYENFTLSAETVLDLLRALSGRLPKETDNG